MLLINIGKRTIDGFKPLETKEFGEEEAKKILGMYKREIKPVVDEVAILKKVAVLEKQNADLEAELMMLKSSENVSESKDSEEVKLTAKELCRKVYSEVYKRDVPNNKINDMGWLIKEISKKR